MIKLTRIAILLLFVLIILDFGYIHNKFTILTGLGTPYSYFEAHKAKQDSILTFYSQVLDYSFINGNFDSLQLIYGFRWVYGGTQVSSEVIELYNSVIEKELHRRLGIRWNEYLLKVDSILLKDDFKIVRPPDWKGN